ncbi:hypothetical protein [uncultured Nitratireductor sp.]|uniref:hypothetical protein n=1 Tax=uncultured Nitratireductor sp. TaxID=520953 RepID=UPI0025E1524E|nr:hypothetical protein [uncultured Nitratireductor sp.]
MGSAQKRDERAETESRRILDRVSRESEGSSMMTRARDHIAASDAEQSDPIELWGTRIGRAIAVTALTALILWLLLYVFGIIGG